MIKERPLTIEENKEHERVEAFLDGIIHVVSKNEFESLAWVIEIVTRYCDNYLRRKKG